MLTVSPSPHIKGTETTNKIMYGVLIALIPALIISFVTFGIDAIIRTLVSIIACAVFEYLIQKFILKGELTIKDGSAIITGVLLAFNVPSNLPIWILLIGCLVAIGLGKMSFGGLGQNPFNPALVGRVFLLISFPVDMTTWSTTQMARNVNPDAITGATPLAIMKEGLKNGSTVSEIMKDIPSYCDMAIGTIGGSLGEVSAIALIIGGIYMLIRKIITWHIPVSIIATMFIFSGILNITNPEAYASPVFHLLAGGTMLGAIFMATDMVTSPMNKISMLIYGCGIGIITIVIRTFGAYPEGMSFAILIMNACVPLLNKYIKPQMFGVKK